MSEHGPTPARIFDTLQGHQRSAVMKAAIELDVFTAIGEGNDTASTIAKRCNASERGIRIVCDFLTINGFLTKDGDRYGLATDSAMFLDRRSPAYMGCAVDFMLAPMHVDAFRDLAAVVRKGGALHGDAPFEPDHPIWVQFARSMMPLMMMPAQMMAEMVPCEPNRPLKVLDIAAGHGIFGISFARQHPNIEVVAQDWPRVLEVATENAQRFGVAERHRTLPGSAFEVDFGAGYDIVLLTNFLHHFDPPTNEKLLKKVHAALAEGGRAVTLDFIPNEDRVSPPGTASFSMTMLAMTPSGDAYTFKELESMFRNAGFSRSEFHAMPAGINQLVISYK